MDIESIIGKMSLEEKIAFCSGATFWKTKAFPQYGIPELFLSDGPHGLRKQEGEGDHLGLGASIGTTCFPTASAAAATWDVDLLGQMGDALGKEAVKVGVNIILGPGVNMKRNPLCGRNFEYYSEDPCLSGKLAAAWIKGVQKHGVGTSVKHFAANNQELKRMSSDSLVDERALREYYLPAFETAVKEASPVTLMCAYNKLNGTFCSDNKRLLWDILRQEWGFEGAVITDWGAMNDRVEAIRAGLDLEMPGSKGRFDAEVLQAVRGGQLEEALVDAMVGRLLAMVQRCTPHSMEAIPENLFEQHHRLARKIAAAGGVLLKNGEGILPLDPKRKITVLGALAKTPRYQGTGSSLVSPYKLSSLLDGLGEHGIQYAYEPGYLLEDMPNSSLQKQAVELAAKGGTVLLCIGLTDIYESEGYDRTTLALPKNQLALLDAVYAVNPNIVVVLVGGSAVEMPWLGKVKAVLHMQLAGQAGGLAAADLLLGKVNPSGKLTETYPVCYQDVASAEYYGKNPKQVPYYESMYCGYRYFDSAAKEVLFPFGFGLSYTTFAYSGLEVEHRGKHSYRVHFTLKNTGEVGGAEVAQLYIAANTDGAYRPKHELKGFTKVFLKPGEEKRLYIPLDMRSFAIFSTEAKQWQVEAGGYTIEVGASSRDIRLEGVIAVEGVKLCKTDCSPWYYTLEGTPGQEDFTTIYGCYPVYSPQTKGSFDMASSIKEMKETSLICKIMYWGMERAIAKSTGGKVDYSNVQFKMLMDSASDNPMKSMPLFAPDTMPMPLAQFFVDAANGHTLKGLGKLLRKKRMGLEYKLRQAIY